ncbi:MAG: DUF2959 domain-containing protein [Enterovibrio sp.]
MRILAVLFACATLLGCQSAYYSAMESIGYHKRDLMVSRVTAASEAQLAASNEFKSALEMMTALTNFKGGQLQETYTKMQAQYDESVEAVEAVRSRIEEVEDVSAALFEEWNKELKQYTNAKLRQDSERKLRATQRSYHQMLAAMKRAEQKMTPVLNTLRDNTLYLKHNLNAAAIGALKGEFASLKLDINRAITEMNSAIKESDRFIETIKK